jgi:hypothetical protein
MQIDDLELRPANWGLRGQRSINSLVPRGHRRGNGAQQRALAAALMRLHRGRRAGGAEGWPSWRDASNLPAHLIASGCP